VQLADFIRLILDQSLFEDRQPVPLLAIGNGGDFDGICLLLHSGDSFLPVSPAGELISSRTRRVPPNDKQRGFTGTTICCSS
jgi:hypothetical protein